MWMTPNARATCKTKGYQLCNYCNILVTTWPITLKTSHTCRHPPGNASLCGTVGVRLHERTCKASNVPRTCNVPDIENGWTNCAQTWYIDGDQLVGTRVAYKSKLGPTLHVRTCRVTVPDLKNGWTDCAQTWYTVRDRLVGCRAQVNWKYPGAISHVQGSLSRSLRWSPQKALYWLYDTSLFIII